mgnify:CR=1 FL=1
MSRLEKFINRVEAKHGKDAPALKHLRAQALAEKSGKSFQQLYFRDRVARMKEPPGRY